MKRDIDKGQDLGLCRVVTNETPVGTLVLYFDKGSISDGAYGVLLKAGQVRSVVDWEDEDPDSHRNAYLRLAPLFWLDKKPVYVGDEVVHVPTGEVVKVTGGPVTNAVDAVCRFRDSEGDTYDGIAKYLSWPKQKFVKYLHLYSDGSMRTRDDAGEAPELVGLTLVETRVTEWEA